MSALVEGQSIEAEIAARCRALCAATEPAAAMNNWTQLRRLVELKNAAENELFRRERGLGGKIDRSLRHGNQLSQA